MQLRLYHSLILKPLKTYHLNKTEAKLLRIAIRPYDLTPASFLILPCILLPFAYHVLDTIAFFLSLKHTSLLPTPEPLRLVVSLPRISSPSLPMAPPDDPAVRSHVTSSEKLSLTTPSKAAWLSLQHLTLLFLLHRTYHFGVLFFSTRT